MGQIRSEMLPEPEALFGQRKTEAEKTKQVTCTTGIIAGKTGEFF